LEHTPIKVQSSTPLCGLDGFQLILVERQLEILQTPLSPSKTWWLPERSFKDQHQLSALDQTQFHLQLQLLPQDPLLLLLLQLQEDHLEVLTVPLSMDNAEDQDTTEALAARVDWLAKCKMNGILNVCHLELEAQPPLQLLPLLLALELEDLVPQCMLNAVECHGMEPLAASVELHARFRTNSILNACQQPCRNLDSQIYVKNNFRHEWWVKQTQFDSKAKFAQV
jgi:hypothetical protein